MFTQRGRHSPFGSLRRPAHLAALAVVIGLLAAMNALPTFAVPIDPPGFEGNPETVASAGGSGTIAYVQRSTYDIHVISPDGTGDRVLWTAPEPLAPYPAYDLAWRPDGRELAFSSEHEEACSCTRVTSTPSATTARATGASPIRRPAPRSPACQRARWR